MGGRATGPAEGASSSVTTGAGREASWLVSSRPRPHADAGREFAFATEEGGRESTVWRYRFEPVEGGTRVTES